MSNKFEMSYDQAKCVYEALSYAVEQYRSSCGEINEICCGDRPDQTMADLSAVTDFLWEIEEFILQEEAIQARAEAEDSYADLFNDPWFVETAERVVKAFDEVSVREKLWNKVLRQYCHCYEDLVGNRPCDNGAVCDRCMGDDVFEIYRKLLEAEGLEP